jgi:thiosulfate dehydrogenase
LKAVILGLIIGVLAVAAAVVVYFETGMAPVATSAPPIPFEKTLANAALHARVEKEMPKTVPVTADEQTYKAGAQIYREHCEVCHGGPTGGVAICRYARIA